MGTPNLPALRAPASTTGLSLIPSADLSGAPGDVWEELVRRWLAGYRISVRERPRMGRLLMGEWAEFCRTYGREPLSIDADGVRAYRADLESRMAKKTAQKRLWVLGGIYAFLVAEDVRRDDPVAEARGKRVNMPDLTPTRAEALLSTWLDTLAPGTVTHRRPAVRAWFTYCRQHGVNPLSPATEDVLAHRREVEAQRSPHWVQRAMVGLRAFYAYLLAEGVIDADPTPAASPAHLRARALVQRLPGTPDLVDLAERWLLDYRGANALTQRGNLLDWLEYCQVNGLDPLLVHPNAVLAYQEQVEAKAQTYAAARQKVATVRAFYAFLVTEQTRPDNPALGTTRRPPAVLAAALAVPGQDRNVEQMALGFLLQYTENTRRAYETALRFWLTYCMEIGVDPLKVSRAHLDAFRVLTDRRYSPRTTNQRLVIIRSFYRYCVEEGAMALNPARAVRLHRLQNISTSKGVTREELRVILDGARRTSPQQHALFTLLAFNGLRISEALGADVENLAHVRGHRTLAVVRKGHWGSLQNVPLAPYTSTVLDTWLTVRAEVVSPAEGNAQHGPLFVTPRSGRRLRRENAWGWLRDLAVRHLPERAGDLHPHDLRNAFITLALDAGVSLRDVQDSAAHASADTTRRYDTGRNNLDRNATYALAAYVADDAGEG